VEIYPLKMTFQSIPSHVTPATASSKDIGHRLLYFGCPRHMFLLNTVTVYHCVSETIKIRKDMERSHQGP
jgi:hypothetical protein